MSDAHGRFRSQLAAHLAEVGVAGDSGQVPEEDEEQVLTIQKRRQPDGSPIRPQEGEVGSGVAEGHFLTFSSLKEVMAVIDCILDRIRFSTSFQNPHAKPR